MSAAIVSGVVFVVTVAIIVYVIFRLGSMALSIEERRLDVDAAHRADVRITALEERHAGLLAEIDELRAVADKAKLAAENAQAAASAARRR